MKVLFISSGNSHYGIVPFIKSQGESLKRESVELDYFTIIGTSVKGYLRNISLLRKHIKNNKYDLIHAHYGLIGLLCILSFTKLPIVISIMGSDAYGSYDKNGKRIKKSYFIMLLTQIALIFADVIIVKSNNILRYVPYKNKSHILQNGVNFEVFRPINNVLKKNVVLFLANPKDTRKNFKLAQQAISSINNSELIFINPYPIKHSQFPKLLNNSSVFILTSYNEGSPNVIKEAMACSIPIVSTDVGDVKEVIGGTHGCYITSFDSDDVAEKINMALDYGKRTTGREDIDHLDSRIVAQKLIDIYTKLLEKY